MDARSPLAARSDRNAGAGRGVLGRIVDRLLPDLKAGRLQLVLPDGVTVVRQGEAPGPEAILHARRWRAFGRLFVEGRNGFANGYIANDWSTPDLAALLQLGLCNEAANKHAALKVLLSAVRGRFAHARRANSRRGSRRNVAAHYDLGNDFFSAWLDAGMNYSSALYRGAESLEQAQRQKLDRVAELLSLRGGERVLEIGCGWGALAERLVRRHGAGVSAITLSAAQLDYTRARLADDIAGGRADASLRDYRDQHGRFDRVVSIEMLEAVGEQYWPVYFARLRACLRSGGIAVLQAITIAEDRFAAYRRRPDFIQRHVFPGGMLPTRSIIESEAAGAGLALVHHEGFGDSYARTLREWRARFLRALPRMGTLGFDDAFCRMWDYYLVYCETGFRNRTVDVGLYKFVAAS